MDDKWLAKIAKNGKHLDGFQNWLVQKLDIDIAEK